MKMKFSDGIEIDLSGPVRVLELHDGFYVVGGGTLMPVPSRQAAEQFVSLHQTLNSESVQKQIDNKAFLKN